MKTLKKVFAVVLVMLMLTATVVMLNSCGKVTEKNPGAIINVYMPYTVSLDPAVGYADEASAKLLSLVYEGLTRIKSNGKLEGALADEWEVYTDRDGQKCIDITLKTTRWSDGTLVDSEDFLDSWERILDPAFSCEAASLLFPIKNAVAVKRGEMTVSDLGINASAQDTLTIILEDWADPDLFLRNCASVALYPVRKDVINKIYDRDLEKENDWSMVVAIMQTNGPFYLKGVSFGSTVENNISNRPYIVLERNSNYYLDPEKNESLDKYVVPYRIHVNMTYGYNDEKKIVDSAFTKYVNDYKRQNDNKDPVEVKVAELKATMTEDQLAALGNDPDSVLKARVTNEIREDLANKSSEKYAADTLKKIRENMDFFYTQYEEGKTLMNGNVPATNENVASAPGDTETVNSMMTAAFYFNTNNEIFKDARVRQALSLALDREAIAALSKKGSAAGTLITDGVFETERKTSFKKNSTAYALSTSADVAAAKSLLNAAGVKNGTFYITVRPVESDIMIAQAAAEAWAELGFTVGVRIRGYDVITYTERQLVASEDKKDENGKPIKEWQDVIIYDGLLHDTFLDAYNTSNFDVMLCDVNMLSTDAFAPLAQFAGIYSCRAYDFTDVANFDKLVYGVTGYYNAKYDEIMAKALVETNAANRAKLLHEAEALLLTDMPITPVIHYNTPYLISDELDDVDFSYFGAPIFSDTSYDDYVPVQESEETTAAPVEETPVA